MKVLHLVFNIILVILWYKVLEDYSLCHFRAASNSLHVLPLCAIDGL